MLKRIHLKDFKSFVDEEVELAPLTLLVGANASGKSNFLDAIRFLKGLSFDLSLSEILNGEARARPDAWPGIRGRAEETTRLGTDIFTIYTLWPVPEPIDGTKLEAVRLEGKWAEVTHSITCSVGPQVYVVREECSEVGTANSAFRSESSKSFLGDRDLHRRQGTPEESVVKILAAALREIQFLSINPAKMRDYGRRYELMGEDGTNFSGLLHIWCENPEDRKEFVTWVREFCAPEIEDIEFLDVKELGDVMAMFVEKGGKRISARSISDGTLHFLGLLLALRTAEPGSVILIEEIEAGLHPTRIRLLVEYLEAVTRERQIQVIATTHSPVVLQWLSDKSLRNTIVFGRVPDHEGTIMRRLGDLPHFSEVVERAGIEEMFTTGWLEMAL